jgi:alkanesulfonate monooxygenase SsuD/methylene tetrahydromethanopterin reductase-like flavin-dependent oxidoreductase (luciferase family)
VSESRAPLGVALTGHRLPLSARLRLAARADELGYDLVMVDGDGNAAAGAAGLELHDSTAVLAAVALRTTRIRIASIHLAHFWNPVLLARSLATLQQLSGGRLVSHFGIGATRTTAAGLPSPGPAERIAVLDETLAQVQTHPIAVSAAGPRALGVVRRHADIWDANVPPLRARLEPLRAQLGVVLPTWLWIFARPGATQDTAVADYRRHAPWFRDLSAEERANAVLWGDAERCRARIEELRDELGLALPIADLAGLDESAAERAMVALAPARVGRIP